MISRILEKQIEKRLRLKDNKAIILLGPRQVGKTTLLQNLFGSQDTLWLNGDDTDVRTMLSKPNANRLKAISGKNKYLIIDEAQRIENIGICIKIITDQLKDIKVIATGSSAFDLANKINEPLTGRKWEYYLYPLSFREMADHHGFLKEKRLLEQRLLYGYYPEVINNPGEEKIIIKSLADSYLYKDILTWERIQKPEKLERLVQALAFQIGSEVSYNELGQMCGLDKETVEKYIMLLEKAFIVFRLNSFSRNLRNELKKSRKIYFYDNGIRNAVINQFSPIESRMDKGALWENFIVSERYKYIHYEHIFCNRYFWRTTAQQEIDYIEEMNGKLYAWEFKWNKEKKSSFTKTFVNEYQPAETNTISPENIEEFIL
ncbi:MAG: ATP-binding protein [Bacteroidia bacterium]|jgi:predicted AAA+ superfamily ATPase